MTPPPPPGVLPAWQLKVPLKPGMVLVMDNKAHAHGRTVYDTGVQRVLWRKNFYNNGALSGLVVHGICAPADVYSIVRHTAAATPVPRTTAADDDVPLTPTTTQATATM